ncbi:MAG: RNB domain-containing ribonuclease [Cetobacterium sp.]
MEIKQRKENVVRGVLQPPKSGFSFVVAVNNTSPDIYIKECHYGDAICGDIVEVKIIEYGGVDKAPTGKVIEVLGNPTNPYELVTQALKRDRITTEFPPNVLKEAQAIANRGIIPNEDFKNRRDMRHIPVSAWDSKSTRDRDDAIYVRKDSEGNFKLYVAIADVPHYVKEGSCIDREAKLRGNTYYLCDRVIHMLPIELSQGLCSLDGGQDKLAMMFEIDVDRHGEIYNYDIYKAVVHPRHNMVYEELNNMFDGDYHICDNYSEEDLCGIHTARELSEVLLQASHKRGMLDFELDELRMNIDPHTNKVSHISKYQRGVSQRVVEMAMILTNRVVGSHMYNLGIPTLYRSHSSPSSEKLRQVNESLNKYGFRLKTDEGIHPKEIQKVVECSKGHVNSDIIHKLILRSLMKANFTVDEPYHFGLSTDSYVMTTSPIRRCDLISNRALEVALGTYPSQKRIDKMVTELTEFAKHVSNTERKAISLEEEAFKTYMVDFAKDKVGKTFKGKIIGFNTKKVFIQTEEYITLSYLLSLDDNPYTFDEIDYSMIRKDGSCLDIGQEVKVLITSANMNLLEVFCDIITQ